MSESANESGMDTNTADNAEDFSAEYASHASQSLVKETTYEEQLQVQKACQHRKADIALQKEKSVIHYGS